MASWLRVLTGAGLGALGGAATGLLGKCTTGTCPLTANPLRGALFGALIGVAMAMLLSTGGCDHDNGSGDAEAAEPAAAATHDHDQGGLIYVTTAEEFDSKVLKADKPVLVDFYADWCPPCKRLAPIIEGLSSEYGNRAAFVKVNGDKSRQLMTQYNVEAYPTVKVFSNGQVTATLVGLRGPDDYRKELDAAIAGS